MPENPYYRFFRRIDLPVSFEQWDRLPRVAGFKNEYWDGHARYSPRPNSAAMELDLRAWAGSPAFRDVLDAPREKDDAVTIRPLTADDWPEMVSPFVGAFGQMPPLCQWRGAAPLRAARAILDWTRLGRDGPLVDAACHVAELDWRGATSIVGVALVTLERPARFYAMSRRDERDELEKEPTLPHLTWIFAGGPMVRRQGIGGHLLDAAAVALRDAGHETLASSCLLENAASMAWHWRHGFKLLASGWTFSRYRRANVPTTSPAAASPGPA